MPQLLLLLLQLLPAFASLQLPCLHQVGSSPNYAMMVLWVKIIRLVLWGKSMTFSWKTMFLFFWYSIFRQVLFFGSIGQWKQMSERKSHRCWMHYPAVFNSNYVGFCLDLGIRYTMVNTSVLILDLFFPPKIIQFRLFGYPPYFLGVPFFSGNSPKKSS